MAIKAPLTYKNLDWTSTLAHLPTIAAASLMGGLGVRLAQRALLSSPQSIPEDIRKVRPQVESVPVRVTKEQAEELKRRGVDVRTVKRAEAASPSVTNAALYGLGAVGAGGAGWLVGDYLSRTHDKRRARDRVNRLRDRIEKLLSDQPNEGFTSEDQRLYSVLKHAADKYVAERTPGFFERAATRTAEGLQAVSDTAAGTRDWVKDSVQELKDVGNRGVRTANTALALSGTALGGLLAYGLIRGSLDARKRRKDERSRLRRDAFDVLRQRHALSPVISPVPYVVDEPFEPGRSSSVPAF